MDRKIFFSVVFLSILPSQLAHADDGTVDLGPVDRVKALFSYPNCRSNVVVGTELWSSITVSGWICKPTPTLEETVTHYLTQSLQRDGFAYSTVSAKKSAATEPPPLKLETGEIERRQHIVATFLGDAAAVYPDQVRGVLQAADAGLKAVRKLQADKKWRNDWRFFLPLGLAWVKHPTLEILIFPPDYTLDRDQDYLAAQTTERWSELLVSLGLTREESERYQDIIDIAPIAAPHDCMGVGSAGCAGTLTDVPSYFHDYLFQLLSLWLSATESKVPRPAVAFGSRVGGWVKQNFGVDLAVAQIGSISVPGVGSVKVIGANHPSYLYRAVCGLVLGEKCAPDPDKKLFNKGMTIMRQDAIVACWQINMGKVPDADAAVVLASCKSNWEGRREDICRLLETEGYRKTPDEAKQYCESGVLKNFVYLSDERAAELEKADR
jgi:hypothetical protein